MVIADDYFPIDSVSRYSTTLKEELEIELNYHEQQGEEIVHNIIFEQKDSLRIIISVKSRDSNLIRKCAEILAERDGYKLVSITMIF